MLSTTNENIYIFKFKVCGVKIVLSGKFLHTLAVAIIITYLIETNVSENKTGMEDIKARPN